MLSVFILRRQELSSSRFSQKRNLERSFEPRIRYTIEKKKRRVPLTSSFVPSPPLLFQPVRSSCRKIYDLLFCYHSKVNKTITVLSKA